MKKIVIVNAVPTNNGDAALVFALYNKLKEMGYDVFISTTNYRVIKNLYPDKNWIKSEYDFNKILRIVFKILPCLKKTILKFKIKNNKQYRNTDIIICAPGGYINSYYGIKEKLYCSNIIKNLYNSKLIMYSQSVGPLNKKDYNVLDKYIYNFDLFMARDEISYENIKKYPNVIKTNDAAFLLNTINNKKKDNGDKIAISVREWNHDGRSKEQYVNLIRNITYVCIDKGMRVEFISTCQGLKSYVDDSKMAKYIVKDMDDKYKKFIEINNNYYTLDTLREYISNFKFTIGTRLHMCILSIMSGIPAFNISYEVKGKECYKILDLSEYSIDYNDNIKHSIQKLDAFIDNKRLKDIYLEKAKHMNMEANMYFEYMITNVIESDRK